MSIGIEAGRAGQMPARPFLKPWYQVIHSKGATLFHYGRSLVAVREVQAADLLGRLIPLMDGSLEQDEIAMRFAPEERQAVVGSIELMSRRELLLDGQLDPGPQLKATETSVFLSAALGRVKHPNQLASILGRAVVGVAGSSLSASIAAEVLERSGIRTVAVESTTGAVKVLDQLSILIVAPRGQEVARLQSINRACLDARTPWILVLPFDGDAAVVGPIFIPWETCCYECVLLRRVANSPFGGVISSFDAAGTRWPTTPAIEHVMAGFTAMAVLRWLIDPATEKPGRAYSLQFGPEMSSDVHIVYRVPRCPACSVNQSESP
jgi:bacteriocin biosynthesis cyclodehydratase domain-containing protein